MAEQQTKWKKQEILQKIRETGGGLVAINWKGGEVVVPVLAHGTDLRDEPIRYYTVRVPEGDMVTVLENQILWAKHTGKEAE